MKPIERLLDKSYKYLTPDKVDEDLMLVKEELEANEKKICDLDMSVAIKILVNVKYIGYECAKQKSCIGCKYFNDNNKECMFSLITKVKPKRWFDDE